MTLTTNANSFQYSLDYSCYKSSVAPCWTLGGTFCEDLSPDFLLLNNQSRGVDDDTTTSDTIALFV